MSGDGARVAYPLFQEEDGGANPTSPLQLKISIIDVYLACALNKKWHSRLPIIKESNVIRNKRSICFGAHYGNLWYAIAIWSSPVAANRLKNGQNILELRRMAISPESPKNTASRMISIMVKEIRKRMPEIIKLISYQDTAVHCGTIYKASGWEEKQKTRGTDWNITRKRDESQTTADKVRWELLIRR